MLDEAVRGESLSVLLRFRTGLFGCLTARADVLFELSDALLCTDGPVRSLVGLALAPEHRRGHGGLYGALNRGRIDVQRLSRSLTGLPLPRAADGRIVLAVDVRPWLQPDAATSPERLFCHVHGAGEESGAADPGRPRRWKLAGHRGPRSWTRSV